MFNKTIDVTCNSKGFEEAIVESKSVKRFLTFLDKHATDVSHLFYFHLTNSTNVFYRYDSVHINSFIERNGTIVEKSLVCCFKNEFTALEKIGIYVGVILAVAFCIFIRMYILSQRNKTVSF